VIFALDFDEDAVKLGYVDFLVRIPLAHIPAFIDDLRCYGLYAYETHRLFASKHGSFPTCEYPEPELAPAERAAKLARSAQWIIPDDEESGARGEGPTARDSAEIESLLDEFNEVRACPELSGHGRGKGRAVVTAVTPNPAFGTHSAIACGGDRLIARAGRSRAFGGSSDRRKSMA
jgi:hypothetical protein